MNEWTNKEITSSRIRASSSLVGTIRRCAYLSSQLAHHHGDSHISKVVQNESSVVFLRLWSLIYKSSLRSWLSSGAKLSPIGRLTSLSTCVRDEQSACCHSIWLALKEEKHSLRTGSPTNPLLNVLRLLCRSDALDKVVRTLCEPENTAEL